MAPRRTRARSRRRAGARRGAGRGGGARVSQTELEQAVGEVLIDQETLAARGGELGAEVSADYEGRDLLLIGVLKGAGVFIADLTRHLTVPCEVDFMPISSHGDATDSSGILRTLKDLDINIEGRHVLV